LLHLITVESAIFRMYIIVLIKVSIKEGAILRYFNIYNILMFVTWILPQLTTCSLVFNQLEASLAEFEIQDPNIIDHLYLGLINHVTKSELLSLII